jgi:hypothetical protein
VHGGKLRKADGIWHVGLAVDMGSVVLVLQIKRSLEHSRAGVIGQLACRFRDMFEAQPDRKILYGLIMDTEFVAVVRAELAAGQQTSVHGPPSPRTALTWKWGWSNLLPLYDGASPGVGVRTLAYLLSLSPATLGYVSPALLGPIRLSEGRSVTMTSVITRSPQRTVYAGHDVESGTGVVIKLRAPGDLDNEVRMLRGLRDNCRFIVRCVGAALCNVGGAQLSCIVLQPLGQALCVNLGAGTLFTVLADVAEALVYARARSVAHRDVSFGNIIVYQGRGVLIDWHVAALESDTQVIEYVGTRLFMSRDYQQHTSPAVGRLQVRCVRFGFEFLWLIVV